MEENQSKYQNFNEVKKDIDKHLINRILEYVKYGTFPNNNSESYMNSYTAVQLYSDKGDEQSQELMDYYNKILNTFIEDCGKKINKISGTQLIDAFIDKTEKINFLIYWMKRIFTYLDRFFTKKDKNSLSKNAIQIYKDCFFNNIQKNIFKEVNKLIKDDRNCNVDSRPKIKIILKIIDDLDLPAPNIIKEKNKIVWVLDKDKENEKENDNKEKEKNENSYAVQWYNTTFEKETKNFAKNKANGDIHIMSAPEYIKSQLKYLDEEKIRQEEYINPIFHDKINAINHQFLIGDYAEELGKMDTGIPYMFKNKRNEELKQAYALMKLFPSSLKVITDAFLPYIKKRGEEINENKEISRDPRQFIPELIKLKKEMDNLVEDCFENHNEFQDTKNRAFSNFMNKDFYAKQLSNYIDYSMKIGYKGKSEQEVEISLNEIIGLFKCINAKLVFIIDANTKLSDRLIKNKSISKNYEKKLISKLKQEQGVNYVNKMTQMMNDLDKNVKEIDDYKAMPHRGMPNGIKFNIQIVSQSAWDISKKSMEKIEIPKFLKVCVEDFENFYYRKHTGQKLIWCLGLSKIDIQYLCFKNKNITTSTLPQYLTLLQLEKYNKLSLSKIASLLGCQVNTILDDISGLVYNPSFNPQGSKDKGLILGEFDENTKEFKENDEIYFNVNFSFARQKFSTLPLPLKKNAAAIKETEVEEAKIQKRYEDNILQANLTRIMKSRIGQKTTHVWLINETSKQIEIFKAQPQQIKENIEKLIEKNIMKRCDNDRTCYEYIA